MKHSSWFAGLTCAGMFLALAGFSQADHIKLAPAGEQTILLPGDTSLIVIWMPAGTFLMGNSPGEDLPYADPQHAVTVGGFWMAKYELTKRQWTAVTGTAPWTGQQYVLADLDSPAVYVSWNDAQSFLTGLNSYSGKTFRLPSEAEWEYACRAGTTTRFYWGDDLDYTAIGDYAWYWGNCSNEEYAHVVGQKLPNAFGLYDMSGNVYEWCEDDWFGSYTGAPAGGQAWVNTPRSYDRILRGGAWAYHDYDCPSAARNFDYPDSANGFFGFRVALTSIYGVDTTPPTGTIVINDNRSATNTPDVTLSLTWDDPDGMSDVVRMRFSDDGAHWSLWEPLAATRAYTLPAGPDGHRTVRVQYLDRANNRSVAYNDYINLDTMPPTGSIVINGGAATTSSLSVSLGLTWLDGSGAGVSRLRFSNDGAHWTLWEPVTAVRAYTLPPPNGYHTVRVQYLDGAGNYSAAYNDYIKLIAP